MCFYIVVILWFLGNARYRILSGFGVWNWGDFVDDVNNILILVDESEFFEGEFSGMEEWYLIVNIVRLNINCILIVYF